MPVPPGFPPRKPQPKSGLFHFVNNYGTKQPAKPTGRHAVALGPQRPASPLIRSAAETRRYYFVLVGEVLRNGSSTQFVGECLYVLVNAKELARSTAEWYKASKLVAEGSVKIDLGIQGRVSGVIGGLVKGTADLTVVKADLFTAKADLTDPYNEASWDFDRAGKNGATKITNAVNASVEIPWLPKTPWGKVALGGMVEQSQWIDGDFLSHDAIEDWGLYVGIPVAQPKGMKSISERMKSNPATAMGKGPSVGTKNGKQKEFYGLDMSFGAALIIGVTGGIKIGVKK